MNDVDYRLAPLGGSGYSTALIEGRGSRVTSEETVDGSMVRDPLARGRLRPVTTSALGLRSVAATFAIGTRPR